MKKTIFLIALTVFLVNGSKGQVNMNCSGDVRVGSTIFQPGYKVTQSSTCFNGSAYNFYVGSYSGLKIDFSVPYALSLYPSLNNNGAIGLSNKAFKDVYCYTLHEISDKRQKENIKPLANSLDLILRLQGVKYDIRREYVINDTIVKNEKIKTELEKGRKNKIGFIAQDVEKVLPEVVFYDDSTDVYTINYSKITPVIVEAIREQQAMIADLRMEIEQLKRENKELQSKSSPMAGNMGAPTPSGPSRLEQNYPNPFSESTEIKYFLDLNTVSAALYFYDMNGRQLKSIVLHDMGNGSVTINGGEFQAGMYMYTLIADGQVVGTKQLVLTD